MVTIMGFGFRIMPLALKLGTGGPSIAYRTADKPTLRMAYCSSFGCASQYAAWKGFPLPYMAVVKVVSAHRKKSRVKSDWLLTDAMTVKVYIKPRSPAP